MIILIWILCAVGGYYIADKKGYNPVVGFILCGLTGVIGLACYAVAKPKQVEAPKGKN